MTSGIQPYLSDGDAKDQRNSTLSFHSTSFLRIIENADAIHLALDVGCGNGRLSAVLATVFDRVIGIDPASIHDSRFAGSTIEYRNESLEKFAKHWTLPSGFDLVLFWGSFYLLPDLEEGLKQARGLLAGNGVIVIGDDKNRAVDRGGQGMPDGLVYDLMKLTSAAGLTHQDEFMHLDYMRVTVLRGVE